MPVARSELEGERNSDQSVTSSRPLEHAGATGETVVSKDPRRRSISENGAHYTDPDATRGTLDTEQVGLPSVYRSPNGGNEQVDTKALGLPRPVG